MEDLGLENILKYDHYDDETHNEQSFSQLVEELDPMPKVGDYYVRAKILLPRGDHMARGHVMARSQDSNGNVVGRSHTNPILDTIMYQVEFAGDKVTELTANVIAESMYSNAMQKGMSIYS